MPRINAALDILREENMIQKISFQKLKELLSKDILHISNHNKDEMAIPSYLHYNPLIRWLMWRRYEYISYMSGFSRDMNVLEFGCGIGLFLPELDSKCNRVYAIDIFPEFARLFSKELHLNVCFIDNLSEIPNGSIDIIIAADVLEHIKDNELVEYLDIFSEKLKSSGRLIISGPTENIIYKIGRVLAGFADKGGYHYTNINNLINVINKYFDLTRTTYLPFKLTPFLFKVCEFKQCVTKRST
jgi:2-polyprenyl-3-methyl-5-hydroxy-6-metoxy-1,4-benzoquinol methylase